MRCQTKSDGSDQELTLACRFNWRLIVYPIGVASVILFLFVNEVFDSHKKWKYVSSFLSALVVNEIIMILMSVFPGLSRKIRPSLKKIWVILCILIFSMWIAVFIWSLFLRP